jgi:POT family proton-dependent oligopeptide transporter
MGINIGAFLAPVVAEFVKGIFGVHPAFAVAAGGMAISVSILWYFKAAIQDADRRASTGAPQSESSHAVQARTLSVLEAVPEWKRIAALLVVFAIVIVFWMVLMQGGSTLTYWADENTAWHVSGTISNAINPFWIIALTFPVVWTWKKLSEKGIEPSTPTKMAIGMFLTALSFVILYFAGRIGEATEVRPEMFAAADFRLTDYSLGQLSAAGVPTEVVQRLESKDEVDKFIVKGQVFKTDDESSGEEKLMKAVRSVLGEEQVKQYKFLFLKEGHLFKVSPLWLILAYGILTLGELLLSPMGLSLVSKVAPQRMRGLMMGGWFVATAIGNKLTVIGVFWDRWLHSSFFAVIAAAALVMAVVLLVLLRPLKNAMPGV